jgi:uncharacterized OB-fold protein
VPAIEGWFTMDTEAPALVGQRCRTCGTTVFPGTALACPNPVCSQVALARVELSRRGRIWSYTDARYQPPPPYLVPTDAHEPFCIAAVELDADGLVVLGQVVPGVTVDDLSVGAEVELVLDTLYVDDQDRDVVVWKWKPTDVPTAAPSGEAAAQAGGPS